MSNLITGTPERNAWIQLVEGLQESICRQVEELDGQARFRQDDWIREEGGGGKTRVISQGAVFEKGGVNTSVVYGKVTPAMQQQLKIEGDSWFACGISIVLHPVNPFVPTVHCNYRMFELYGENGQLADRWFGGGTDLTPYYLFEEDAVYFHKTYKKVCDAFDPAFYSVFKNNCDNYFVNTHRGHERRGIGGIFYDYQRPGKDKEVDFWMEFGKACGNAFAIAYLPLVEKRKDIPYAAEHKFWQEIRRGRYVEFNLVHDRGTLFGLKTNGRTESILMSLPPTVRFEYDYHPAAGSEEEKLVQACLEPVDWASSSTPEEWAKRSNTC